MSVRLPIRKKPALPARGLSIRARLMLLALLAVVPLTVDRVRLLETSRVERLETARAEVINLAGRAVESQSELLRSSEAVLRVLSRASAFLIGSGRDCAATLTRFATDIPWLTSISVVGSHGRIVCSSLAVMQGKDLSDREYIQRARRSGTFVLSDFVIDGGTGAPAMVAAQSARSDGDLDAHVLAAPIDLHWIGRASGAIAHRHGAASVLLDRAGIVVATNPEREGMVGDGFTSDPVLARMLLQEDGQTIFTWPDGVRRITAYARLPGTDARVVVGLDEGEVLSRIDGEIGIAYLQLALFGLLVLLATWFGGEQLIVHPIHALAQVATRIGRGELSTHPTGHKWAAEFVPLVTALTEAGNKVAARELALRSANRHLEALATIDSLTGLANRRSFDAHLDAEWQRAHLSGRTLGLLMIDVDHFKLFNDNYGHVEGDRCLQAIGDLLNAAAEGDGFAARYGGEEFALLMPETVLRRALQLADTLRRQVVALGVTHSAAPEGAVTVSIGVACLVPGVCEPPQVLIEAADAGLYQAKRCGRNRVATEAPALVPVGV
jgi:diguanylate cyclase (GGDEF)-like protein